MDDPDVIRVNNAAAALAEFYDSVQIIVTKTEGDGTTMTHAGRGNWYARYGSIREYLTKIDERSKESIRREGDDD